MRDSTFCQAQSQMSGGKKGRSLVQDWRSVLLARAGVLCALQSLSAMAGHLASTAVGVIGRREGQSCLRTTTNAPVLRPARLSTVGARLRSNACTQDRR